MPRQWNISKQILSNAANGTLNADDTFPCLLSICCSKYSANDVLLKLIKILRIWRNAATWCHSEFNSGDIDNSISKSYKTVLHVYHSKLKKSDRIDRSQRLLLNKPHVCSTNGAGQFSHLSFLVIPCFKL